MGADELEGLNDYFLRREQEKEAIVEDSVSLVEEEEVTPNEEGDSTFDF